MKNWFWKIYFWFVIAVTAIEPLLLIDDGGKHSVAYGLDTVFAAGYVIALYSYLYRKFSGYLSYWSLFFWINIAYYSGCVLYELVPHTVMGKYLAVLSETGAPTSVAEAILSLIMTFPVLYAIYQLSKGKGNIFHHRLRKKKSLFKKIHVPNLTSSPYWNTVQTAVWGYSTIMMSNILIASLLPSRSQGSSSPDLVLDILTFFPLAMYWMMVLAEYKQYHWSWRKKTLMLNSILYIYLIFNSIFSSALHPVVQTEKASSGFNLIGFSEVVMSIISLIIFGKEMLRNLNNTMQESPKKLAL